MGIPQHVSASKAVAGRQHFLGELPLAQLPRLGAMLAGRDGALAVDLQAGRDAAGQWLRGTVRGDLSLTCQRGLHPFPWSCDLSTDLRLVSSDAEEKRTMQDTEAYLVEDDRLALRDIVEDEVLLALPMMPRCDDPDCLKRL
jgi:uncharacterized protein